MKLDLDYLKELYEEFDNEDLQEQQIDTFEDFITYIEETLIDNIYYDFKGDYSIVRSKLFK